MLIQVFATALDTYFQLTVMLMILVIGCTLLPHLQPFENPRSQIIQVSLGLRMSTICQHKLISVA